MTTARFVLMICGPHHDPLTCPCYHEGTLCFSRPDHAITEALMHDAALLISGDGNRGDDVRRFHRRATKRFRRVVPLVYETGVSSTLLDIGMALDFLDRQALPACVEITLVTDPWHLPRANCMLVGELSQRIHLRDRTALKSSPVNPFWTPPEEVLVREGKGIHDYAAGSYDHAKGHPFGKPAHGAHDEQGL